MNADQTLTLLIAAVTVLVYLPLAMLFMRKVPGDRFIQFGITTLAATFLLGGLERQIPEWLFNALFFIVFELAVTSIYFGCRQAYQYFARRESNTRNS